MRSPSEFQLLKPWRRHVLRKKQSDIARAVWGDPGLQSLVSEIENGHMPSPFCETYELILREYGLSHCPEEFERMVANGAIEAKKRKSIRRRKTALSKPISETDPLYATAKSDCTGSIEGLTATVYENAKIIGQQEQDRRVS